MKRKKIQPATGCFTGLHSLADFTNKLYNTYYHSANARKGRALAAQSPLFAGSC